VLKAFHILNNFDIPKGSARDNKKDEHGNIEADYIPYGSVPTISRLRGSISEPTMIRGAE